MTCGNLRGGDFVSELIPVDEERIVVGNLLGITLGVIGNRFRVADDENRICRADNRAGTLTASCAEVADCLRIPSSPPGGTRMFWIS